MKRSTNRKILKYSLWPALTFAIFALAFPETLEGTENPTAGNYVAYALFAAAGFGVLTFWVGGVMANAASLISNPLEDKRKAGQLKPGGYGDRVLSSLWLFRSLNIYVDRE